MKLSAILIHLLVLSTLFLPACASAPLTQPNLLTTYDPFTWSGSTSEDYTIQVSPLADAPSTELIKDGANQFAYFTVQVMVNEDGSQKILYVVNSASTGTLSSDFKPTQTIYFVVSQQITKPGIVVNPVHSDATTAMRSLCASTAKAEGLQPYCP